MRSGETRRDRCCDAGRFHAIPAFHSLELMPVLMRALRAATFLCACLVWAPAFAEVLTVESLSGPVRLERNGNARELLANEVLRSGDRLLTAPDAQLRLGFARYGFVDVGPDSDLRVERIPHAAFATDLRSVFRLHAGYARLVWKHPQISTSWPIFVYVDAQRASVTAGEYFFEHRAGRQIACVAAGQMAVTHADDVVPMTLHPQACYRLYAGLQPQRILRESGDWVAIRGKFGIGELPLMAGGGTTAPVTPVAQPQPTPSVVAEARPLVGPPGGESQPRPRPAQQVPQPAPALAAKPVPAKPEPAAKPAGTERAAVGVGTGPWALSIASFRELEAAQQLMQRMAAAGFTAERVPVTVKGKPWHRVMVLGFESVAEAKSSAADIEAKLQLSGAWVLRYKKQ